MCQCKNSGYNGNREKGVPDRGRADDFCRLLGSVGSNTLQTLRGILLLPRRSYRYEVNGLVCPSVLRGCPNTQKDKQTDKQLD